MEEGEGKEGHQVTNVQLYLAIGIPVLVNAAMFGLLAMYMNARFDAVNQRFDDLRDLWRAELHRVGRSLTHTKRGTSEKRKTTAPQCARPATDSEVNL